MIFITRECDLWKLGGFYGGMLDGWKFEVKVYNPSSFGIRGGRLVKLFVYKPIKGRRNHRGYQLVIAYDRGWFTRKRPKEPRAVAALRELRAYFDGGITAEANGLKAPCLDSYKNLFCEFWRG